MLASLPESDWQNHQAITLLVDDETYATADHDQFKFELATLLVRVAFPHQLRRWQVKDWKGVCESAADVGMLLLPHGLLKLAYPLFLCKTNARVAAAERKERKRADMQVDSEEGVGDALQLHHGGIQAPSDGGGISSVNPEFIKIRDIANPAGVAMEWIQEVKPEPATQVIGWRFIASPIQTHLDDISYINGKNWS